VNSLTVEHCACQADLLSVVDMELPSVAVFAMMVAIQIIETSILIILAGPCVSVQWRYPIPSSDRSISPRFTACLIGRDFYGETGSEGWDLWQDG